jgi:hypothetical protein
MIVLTTWFRKHPSIDFFDLRLYQARARMTSRNSWMSYKIIQLSIHGLSIGSLELHGPTRFPWSSYCNRPQIHSKLANHRPYYYLTRLHNGIKLFRIFISSSVTASASNPRFSHLAPTSIIAQQSVLSYQNKWSSYQTIPQL